MKDGGGGGGRSEKGEELLLVQICIFAESTSSGGEGPTTTDPLQGFFFRFLWWIEGGVGRGRRRLKGLLQVFAFPCAVED